MANKTFTAGETLTAADVNTYLASGFKAVETGASQAISASGTTVTFASSRFAATPNVQVTQANTGGGASKVPNVDAISTSSCRIFLLNASGAFIAGDASWLATLEA